MKGLLETFPCYIYLKPFIFSLRTSYNLSLKKLRTKFIYGKEKMCECVNLSRDLYLFIYFVKVSSKERFPHTLFDVFTLDLISLHSYFTQFNQVFHSNILIMPFTSLFP